VNSHAVLAYTDPHMPRGLSALSLAFVIAGAQVATTVCQVRCAIHDTDAALARTGVEHHSCHGASSSTGPAVSSRAHSCGHADDIQMGTYPSTQDVAAPAVVAATVTFFPTVADAPRVRSTRVEKSPPGSVALISQLRV
jgi:hypothetical protein